MSHEKPNSFEGAEAAASENPELKEVLEVVNGLEESMKEVLERTIKGERITEEGLR